MRLLLLLLIRFYKFFVSPWLPAACRFTPSCSDYARDAVCSHGAITGGALALKRLARCHPFGHSAYDPVPCRKCPAHE